MTNAWPRTVREALQLLRATLTPAELALLRDIEYDDLPALANTFGCCAERACGLRAGNAALLGACRRAIGLGAGETLDPAGAAEHLVERLWGELRGEA